MSWIYIVRIVFSYILSSCNTSEKTINTDDVKINLGDVSVSTEKEEMKKPLEKGLPQLTGFTNLIDWHYGEQKPL